MTIDQNQTSVGEEEAPRPAPAAGTASDAPSAAIAAAPTVIPPTPADETFSDGRHLPEPPVPEAFVNEATDTPPSPGDPTPPAPMPPPTPPAPPAPAPIPQPGTPPQPQASDADLFESYMSAWEGGEEPGTAPDANYRRLQRGDRREATIIQVDADKVFVDLGGKAEGIVPLSELSEDNLETAVGRFNVGDKINVVVIRPEGTEGNPIVSKRRADFEEIWDRIEHAYQTQEMISAPVVDRVKGGLVVDIGVRGFVPATHVGSGKLRNIEKFVGAPLQLKVIEIDRDRKKVVLSNRQAEEERRKSARENIFGSVKPGDRLTGAVRRLTDYGAFVDLGGVDGLLHISEMSWARINHPKEMFKEGQKIEVMVLRLDPAAGKISLGHRQVLPDPWNLIKQNYRVGQTLKVNISRIVQSGAFIRLPEGAEAFMPVSEMSFRRIKRPQDVVEEGQEVEAQILDLRPDERRMVLSMRAIGGGGELRPGAQEAPSGFEEDLRRAAGPKKDRKGRKGGRPGRDEIEEFEDAAGRRGFATGGATIGERLGLLKGFLGREDEPGEPKEETPEEE